jgi:predicted Zn-ribbon and HTH transcriptional regulator
MPFEDAIALGLRRIDSSISVNEIKDLVAGRDRSEVLEAFHHTQRSRPRDVLSLFRSRLKRKVAPEVVETPRRSIHVPEDPYASD